MGQKKDKVLRAKDLGINLKGSEQIIERVDDPTREFLEGGDPMAADAVGRASIGTKFSSGSRRHGEPDEV